MIRHTGRRSGRLYETPIMVFRRNGVAAIALTYGPGADWVRNVVAAGGCELVVRHRATAWTRPEIVQTADVADRLPRMVRFALRLLRANDFLRLSAG